MPVLAVLGCSWHDINRAWWNTHNETQMNTWNFYECAAPFPGAGRYEQGYIKSVDPVLFFLICIMSDYISMCFIYIYYCSVCLINIFRLVATNIMRSSCECHWLFHNVVCSWLAWNNNRVFSFVFVRYISIKSTNAYMTLLKPFKRLNQCIVSLADYIHRLLKTPLSPCIWKGRVGGIGDALGGSGLNLYPPSNTKKGLTSFYETI